MEKYVNRERVMKGDNHNCDLYSGRKFIGDTSEIFAYSVIFYHVARNGVEVSDRKNEEGLSKGVGPLPISWDMYLVCIECYQGKKIVSVEGYFMVTPFF